MSKVINLLCRITFSNNRRIEILYRADGVKLSSEMIMDNLPDGMALKKLAPGVVAETPAADDDAAVTSKESKSLTANIIDTKTYIGNYEFTGDSLTRFKTPYGYFLHGHFYAIDYDYQGSHKESGGNYVCGVAQENRYYPCGLPISGGGNTQYTPYLFGNKEFEDRQGLNIYDFGARNLAANAWTTPDPKAHDYHWLSPYAYCGGDPINNIDLWGMETLALSKNDTIQTYANNVPDDPQKLTVYSHGNYSGFDYDIHNSDGIVCNGSEFINAIKTESVDHNEIENEIGLEIELKACNAGADNPEGKPNIAQKISEKLFNAFVTGPNGRVKIHYNTKNNKITDLTETVLDKKDIPISGNNLTTTYFRGQKINPAHIPGIKSMLILQSKPIGKINNPVLLPLK